MSLDAATSASSTSKSTVATQPPRRHIPIVRGSSGIHVTLPSYYSPRKMGLLDPETSDGRVIFFLPWEGNTIAGTTDVPVSMKKYEQVASRGMDTVEPKASEEEIRWVLEEIRRYLSEDIRVRRGDVLSVWSGIRPLVRQIGPNEHLLPAPPPGSSAAEAEDDIAGATQGLVRNHLIHVSPSGLLTIVGGKWTTYRAMAEEAVDRAVKEFGLEAKAGKCVTEKLRLIGSEGWSRNMFIGLIQRVSVVVVIFTLV
jgi:glycerol-3-phosphate dehydrogenase